MVIPATPYNMIFRMFKILVESLNGTYASVLTVSFRRSPGRDVYCRLEHRERSELYYKHNSRGFESLIPSAQLRTECFGQHQHCW